MNRLPPSIFPPVGSSAGPYTRDTLIAWALENRISTIEGAPIEGTNAVLSLSISGTSGGSIRLRNADTNEHADVEWSNVNNTLSNRMNTALDTLYPGSSVNAVFGGVAGIGSFTITFSGTDWGKRPIDSLRAINNLTGAGPALNLTTSTPGVYPSGYGKPTGAIITSSTGAVYVNAGSPTVPVLTPLATGASLEYAATIAIDASGGGVTPTLNREYKNTLGAEVSLLWAGGGDAGLLLSLDQDVMGAASTYARISLVGLNGLALPLFVGWGGSVSSNQILFKILDDAGATITASLNTTFFVLVEIVIVP